MNRHRAMALSGACSVVCASALVALFACRSNRPRRAATVALVAPQSDEREAVVANPGEFVEFVYEVRNSGNVALRDLRLDGDLCQCDVTRRPPDVLAPGAGALVSFRVRAPHVGTARRLLRLAEREDLVHPLAVAELAAAVRVNVDPPQLVSLPDHVRLIAVGGKPTEVSVMLSTVETACSEPAIRQLSCELAARVRQTLLQIREDATGSASNVLRTYFFTLALDDDVDARRDASGSMIVRLHAAGALAEHRIPLEATYLPTLAVAPSELALGGPAAAKCRVAVVDRSSGANGPITLDSYDSTLLDIERVGEAPVWEVAIRGTSAAACVTKVRFRAGESRAKLVVRWAGRREPEGQPTSGAQGAIAPTD